ncbi:MAG: hypothetical protein WCS75_10525 [Sphingomonas sp.]|jgi:hypothetical protein|uniref:hypothetical protein n=1 Tax=Sphingomonas sp. TaxID=28214 RepID=UPI003563BB59
MAEREGFALLLEDLAAMPAHSRRAILGALSPEERGLLATWTETVPAQRELQQSDLSEFSPWLAARIDSVRAERAPNLIASGITASARQALLRGLEGGESTPAAGKNRPGKSLLDSFRGKLAAPMGRP